jgi:hypothetical protein
MTGEANHTNNIVYVYICMCMFTRKYKYMHNVYTNAYAETVNMPTLEREGCAHGYETENSPAAAL